MQLSIIGLSARLMIVLELGPLLTGLVLTGRVGARMTAEIGTMRVTEQIDALETLAYDPIAFLIVPRLLAVLDHAARASSCFADAMGLLSGYLVSVLRHRRDAAGFHRRACGSASAPSRWSTVCSRRRCSACAIAFVCSYEGYITEAGAEGVGPVDGEAVVITSVTILVLDALTAALLAPYLQT